MRKIPKETRREPGKETPLGVQIREIRSTLGMTQEQLAQRAETAQPVVARVERSSAKDLRLSTVQKIAEALHCDVLVELVPKENLSRMLEAKSLERARKLVAISSGNMALELQRPDPRFIEKQVEVLKQEILQKHRRALWEEPEK